ncbi:MAG: crossover junction endodeoxyribonuclease RuvC [Flammeovirgaceae bacterium]
MLTLQEERASKSNQMITKIQKATKERIILGVDPGTNVMGYGIIMVKGSTLSLIQYGVIHLKKYDNHALKLQKIFERMLQLIDDYHPDEMALEAPFYGKNVQSMLKLGRAQGVAMAAALYRQIPITEYAPKKVKQSVTGSGSASKEQVAQMIMQILKFKNKDEEFLLDATDALGVALCHYYQNGNSVRQSKSWKSFVTDNPDRIKGK